MSKPNSKANEGISENIWGLLVNSSRMQFLDEYMGDMNIPLMITMGEMSMPETNEEVADAIGVSKSEALKFISQWSYDNGITDKIYTESKASEYGDAIHSEDGNGWDQGGFFFGIPNMTRDDYEGTVYWKGKPVEHYDHDYFGGDSFEQDMEHDARELAEKCKDLESRGITPTTSSILSGESKASEQNYNYCYRCKGKGYDKNGDTCIICDGEGITSSQESKASEGRSLNEGEKYIMNKWLRTQNKGITSDDMPSELTSAIVVNGGTITRTMPTKQMYQDYIDIYFSDVYEGESKANEEIEYTGGDYCGKCGTEFEDKGECKKCDGESKAGESVTIDDFKRIKDNLLAEKLNFEQGSALVDIQTANAIVAVWDNINEEQRLKFPLHLTSAHNVARLAGIAFKSSERLARDDEETYTGYYSRPKGAVPQTGNCPDCGHDVGQHSGASTGDTICYGGGNCDCGRTFPYIKESKAGESISDSDKQILGDWVSQNRDWTTIDDLPNEIFIPLMAPFGDDTDKRVEAQVEIINYMKSLGESDIVSESWSQKSSINRIEALERVGVKQGDAIKLSSLEFEDFGEDLQGALKGDVEDARKKMKAQKAFLDKDEDNLADITTSTGDIQKFSGFKNQQGGEVENPNSEFQQSYPDYNNIGESQTNMTSYECQYCDDGFKSNEALSIHHNDKHAISPESFDGYATETEYAMGNYTDWFVQVDIPNTVQCDYCSAQFNADDQEGMISHINSTHDAGVDPVTGDTGKSWGESKATEIGMHGGDGASFYDGKTFTCDKCGKVGNSFSDMAQEECPADVNANHQIPIFGDMKKESYAQEDDLDTLMWDNENPDDKDKQWKDKKGKKNGGEGLIPYQELLNHTRLDEERDFVLCNYCNQEYDLGEMDELIDNNTITKHLHGHGIVSPVVTAYDVLKDTESKASEDYFEDEDGNLSSVMKWKLVYDDGSDYGVQTDNKAEAQRTVDQWNETNSDRPIKIVSQESKASEFNIGTTMICPICKKEIETGNEDSFYHDGNFYDPNSVPMSYKMQDHFEQEHTAEDFGVQNKNFKGASDGYEAFEDWKTGNQLSLAFRNSFPEYNQDDAIMMNNADKHSTLDSDGNRMPDDYEGESKANEVPFSDNDTKNEWIWTCPKCSQQIDYVTNKRFPIDHLRSHGLSDENIEQILTLDFRSSWKMDNFLNESKASEGSGRYVIRGGTGDDYWELMDDQTDDLELAKMMADNSKYDPETKYGSIKASVFDLDDNGKVVYTSESKASELLEIPAELQDLIQNSRSDPDLEELRKAIKTYYEKLNGEGKGYNTWGGYRERQSDMNELEDHINQLIKNAKGKRNQNNWNLYESKASEDHDSNYDYLENRDTQEDNVCAECGFVTSDNSEYLDHLNSHEE